MSAYQRPTGAELAEYQHRAVDYLEVRQRLDARAYYIAGADGGEYSADAGDYWHAGDLTPVVGALVRRRHPYVTITGRVILGQRMLKSSATVGDLRRLERAAKSDAGVK